MVHPRCAFSLGAEARDTPPPPIGPLPLPPTPSPSRAPLLSSRHASFPPTRCTRSSPDTLHVGHVSILSHLFKAPFPLPPPAMRAKKKKNKKKKKEKNCQENCKAAMERRGGCCIAKYGGEGGGDYRADVAWKVGRIMLRFRPIAPKPAVAPPVAAAGGAAAAPAETRTAGRARRKAGGGGGGREGRRGRKARKIATGAFKEETGACKEEKEEKFSSSSSESSAAGSGTTVTLPLIPETPETKEAASPAEVPAVPYVFPAWLRVQEGGAGGCGGGGGEVVTPRPVRPAGSWVTVECVTDTWRVGEVGAAATGGDEAVRAALEADEACPSFISDAWDRVTWTNEAYRRMVGGPAAEDEKEEGAEEEDEEEDVRVALVTRGMVPGATCRAFTCRVRVRYASRRRGRGSLAAPCDVWRMDDGGYAWRLDVKAALSLSLGR